MTRASVAYALVLALVTTVAGGSLADERPVYVKEIRDRATFTQYARRVGADELGKFIIDLGTGEIRYFDVNLFALHRDFVFKVILQREMTPLEHKEYNRNYHEDKPRFVLGYLAHHLKGDTWDFSFWEGDKIRPDEIRRTRERLLKTFFVPAAELKWRPESTLQEAHLKPLADLPTITNDQLYKDAPFQAFHTGKAVGKLHIVPPGTPYESLSFARDEIVVLQESYPDLPPVAGIVSTTFSTPLSHVNLRARAWNVPNAGIKGAAATYAALDGKLVAYQVSDDAATLRAATPAEAAAQAARKNEARTVRVPPVDLTVSELRPLFKMRAADARVYGSKAANLGEIAHARLPKVHIPDGFGIPFTFYDRHMKTHGLDAEVEKALGAAPAARKAAFDALRAQIAAAPLDEALLEALWAKVTSDLGSAGVFVRSSTNAEDLPGFNGAGLYDTVANVKSREALAAAVRQVWASLWSLRAVEERELFGIDQHHVYAGILIQIGVNATAAGVLVTRNLFDASDDHSYTINAKRGLGMRVVGGTTVPEQVVYDVKYPGAKVVSRSDDKVMLVFDDAGGLKEIPVTGGSKGVLTEKRARELAFAVKSFVKLFDRKAALDVEWVLEGDKIWIVQARPFVDPDRAP